jgi:hypothetical protein
MPTRSAAVAVLLLLAGGRPQPGAAAKSLRWYIDNVPRVEGFLLGGNPGWPSRGRVGHFGPSVLDVLSNLWL